MVRTRILGLGFGSDPSGGATERGVTGSICEIGAGAGTWRARFGATGTGLTVVFGGVVVRGRCLTLAFAAVGALLTEGRVVVRGAIEVLARALASGAGLTGAFLRALTTTPVDLARWAVTFLGLAFFPPLLCDRA
jgi:hypothetical protein